MPGRLQQRARAWFQERAAAWRWRPKGASAAPTSPQNTAPAESRELVDRLLSQVEALKSEVRELTEAQQQPAQANAAIEAEQESRNRSLIGSPRLCSARGDRLRGL